MSGSSEVTRREMLKIAGGAVAAAQMTALRAAAADLRFFTTEEYALTDALAELIIPADEHSGGARAAGVALYIDGRLAEAFTDEPRKQWREGLKHVDELASATYGRPFLQLNSSQQMEMLERLAAAESKPESGAERFFVEIKRRTIDAYYTSRVGIHDDLQYKGNVMLEEFVGIDVAPRR